MSTSVRHDTHIFKTGKVTRFFDTLLALVWGGAMLVLVPVFGGVVGAIVDMCTGLTWLAIFAGVMVPLVTGRWVWRGTIEQLRFCVLIQPESLQLGSGIASSVVDYETVDEVTVLNDDLNGTGIGITTQGRDYSVRLSYENAVSCFRVLQDRCPNAVFIDADGHETVSVDHERPEDTALLIEKYKRRSGLRWTFACVSALSSTIWQLLMIVQWLRGTYPATKTEVVEMFITEAFLVLVTLSCAVFAREAFSQSRQAHDMLGCDPQV